MGELAINGGNPLFSNLLGKWPDYTDDDKKRLEDVLVKRNWGGESHILIIIQKSVLNR